MRLTLKKILSILLGAVMVLGCVACGVSNSSGTDGEQGDPPKDTKPTTGGQDDTVEDTAPADTDQTEESTSANEDQSEDTVTSAEDSSESGEDQEPDKPTDIKGLAIVLDGAAKYRIVRADAESRDVRSSAIALGDAIKAACGVSLSVVSDSRSYDGTVKEIIIGQKNNRTATVAAVELLRADSFCIAVQEGNIVIVGDTDASTMTAVEYFTQTYVKGESDSLILPAEIQTVMSLIDLHMMNYDKTVTLKKSYSDYISDYEEKTLIPFDEGDIGYTVQLGGFYDKTYTVDGNGALRWDLKGKLENLTKILEEADGTFLLDATDKNRTTIKFWLYVSDTDAVVCDHDAINGFQKNQATFYFRAVDKSGKTHCWNHTLTNNGWHEVELSFNIHNGVHDGFDYANITGFWVGLCTYDDVTIMLDDMRSVVYSTDYVPQPIEGERNPRLISDCEYNALDGAIIQEWYGASYDFEDKVEGSSSLRNFGDASVSDFRTIVANMDIAMDREKDVLVFSLKVATPRAIQSVLIELNEVQDQHEISKIFTLEDFKQYGYTGEADTWCEIRIPLSDFDVQLHPDMGETVTLHNFRFCASASASGTFDYNIDHIYLAEK